MQRRHIDLLICPICGSPLYVNSSSQPGELKCTLNRHSFLIRNGIPRFVTQDNYAESFGFQWNKFSRVQMDSYNGTTYSEERFQSITGWTKADLAGRLVLDVGCGAGRFSEIAIKYGADLVAFDLSDAVDAWKGNLPESESLVCQASIYEMPFIPEAFDFVYCIGVIQHTPNPLAAVRALCRMVKPGGQIGLWIYEHNWKSYLGTLGFKYTLRPVLSRLSSFQQYTICKTLVDLFSPIAAFCKSRGSLGKAIMRLLPIASAHLQAIPLRPEDFKTWILLDTFDMYSPAYDKPQSYTSVARCLTSENFENIQRQPHVGISITARRRD